MNGIISSKLMPIDKKKKNFDKKAVSNGISMIFHNGYSVSCDAGRMSQISR